MHRVLHFVKHGFFLVSRGLLLVLNQERLSYLVYSLIKAKARSLPPTDSLKFLFPLQNMLYNLTIKEAVRYGNGIHPKHRHLKYHDFFIRNIEPGSRVLDVGCGNGAVAFDIAAQVPGVFVHGIDLDAGSIDLAHHKFSADNLQFTRGDVLHDLPEQQFDIIMLSNVLEHLEQRVDFLRQLQHKYRPRKILVRVPIFERHWSIPLQEELGLDYRLDKTHCIEYRQEVFAQEIADAGLYIRHSQINWGEIWAEIGGDNR